MTYILSLLWTVKKERLLESSRPITQLIDIQNLPFAAAHDFLGLSRPGFGNFRNVGCGVGADA
jgi:hypothetical protein